MLKNNKVMLIVTSVVLLLPMAVGMILWDQLPEDFSVSWNDYDYINYYGESPAIPRAVGVFGLPGFMLLLHWLGILITAMDPRNQAINRKSLTMVLWICPVINLLLCFILFMQGAGYGIHVSMFLPMLIGILFILIGNYMPKCKKNYSIGIKVRWALEDEGNWNATHRFAGKVWVIGGAIMFLLPWLQAFWHIMPIEMQNFWSAVSFWGVVGMILVLVLIPSVYSFCYYKKHRAKE